jgi:uncharacterized protein (TIGR03435 family)
MKALALIPLLGGLVLAQQDAASPTFEVASVKVAEPMAPMAGGIGARAIRMGGCGKPDPAQVHCTSTTFKMLLMRAYNVKSYQIEGPAWINSETYDVMAKVPDGVSADKVPAMLQALLAERFAAKIHKETRSLPAYELTIAKGGPKLQAVEADKLPSLPEPGSPMPMPPPPRGPANGVPALSSLPVGAVMMMMNINGSRILRGNMTIAQFADHLTNSLARPVFDNTGLKGTYAIEVSYMGDEIDGVSKMMPAAPPPGLEPGGRADSPRQPDSNTPIATIFQAIQETLGLKLEPKKAPVDMIVVDSANKVPTEN